VTKKSYTNPSESGKYTLEYATLYSKGGKIDIPLRVVVIQYLEGHHAMPFAVRWQDKKGNTFGGSSYQDKTEAHNAFLEQYLRHNKSYKEGNPSHLPGLSSRV